MLSLSVLSSSSSEPPPAPGWSLPQSLASTADLSDWPAVTSHQSGTLQAVWTAMGIGAFVATLVVVRRARDLRSYKYMAMVAGVVTRAFRYSASA